MFKTLKEICFIYFRQITEAENLQQIHEKPV